MKVKENQKLNENQERIAQNMIVSLEAEVNQLKQEFEGVKSTGHLAVLKDRIESLNVEKQELAKEIALSSKVEVELRDDEDIVQFDNFDYNNNMVGFEQSLKAEDKLIEVPKIAKNVEDEIHEIGDEQPDKIQEKLIEDAKVSTSVEGGIHKIEDEQEYKIEELNFNNEDDYFGNKNHEKDALAKSDEINKVNVANSDDFPSENSDSNKNDFF